MNTVNVVKNGVDEVLKGAQFRRKSNTWYRDLEETILVVDVQKSNFGEQYYVNLGVLVNGLPVNHGSKLPSKENQCQIRLRIEALEPGEERQLQQMFNLEDGSVGEAERQQRIESAIVRVALPFLIQCSTRAGIRSAHDQGQLDDALVHKSVRESILGSTPRS